MVKAAIACKTRAEVLGVPVTLRSEAEQNEVAGLDMQRRLISAEASPPLGELQLFVFCHEPLYSTHE
jgi:hypothetical protein